MQVPLLFHLHPYPLITQVSKIFKNLFQRKHNKSKVKKFKYHEYKPPGAKDKDDKPGEGGNTSETPYKIILKQQQLLLQLQVNNFTAMNNFFLWQCSKLCSTARLVGLKPSWTLSNTPLSLYPGDAAELS